jgi:hypothetical protein
LLAALVGALVAGGLACTGRSPTGPLADAAPPDRTADHPGCLGDRPVVPHDARLEAGIPSPDRPPAPPPDLLAADVGAPDRPLRPCPTEMVLVDSSFCMDLYEASRPDATRTSEGRSTARAVSKKGVLPWQGVNLSTARAACKAAGKYLCRLQQWIKACQGPARTVYGYGNTYKPARCNGIDKYCDCSATGPCAKVTPCPYTACYFTCGANFRVDPTGISSGCKSSWGIYDINGNVWELTDTSDGLQHFRGGAFNCGDSRSLHRCDHDGTWGPSAQGFRCCKKPYTS